MQASSTRDSSPILKTVVVIAVSVFTYFEQTIIWAQSQNLHNLFSPRGIVAFAAFILLISSGYIACAMGIWQPDLLQQRSKRFSASMTLRFSLAVGLLITYTYIFLYSTWQTVLSTPWLQLAFAMGLAQIIQWIAAPDRRQTFSWSEFALALTLLIYPRIVLIARELPAGALIYRWVTILGFAFITFITFALYSAQGKKISTVLIQWRTWFGRTRYVLISLFCFVPILHRYLVTPEIYVLNIDIRFAIWLITVWVAAYLASDGSSQLVRPEALELCFGVSLLVSFVAQASLLIVDYPFTLYWSEGNRFYDYSLIFGQSLYNYAGTIVNPYASPGRYGLWGVLFFWHDLPIWAHRLWNLILNTVPAILFATLITRKLNPSFARYGTLIWIALFLIILAPLHPPFVVTSIIMALSAFDRSPLRRGSLTAFAGYYVAISRFTWAFAPGAIGLLIDLLLYYPGRNGKWIRRILPAVLIAVLGVLPGVYLNFSTFQSTAQGIVSSAFSNNAPSQIDVPSQNTTLPGQQALLWERLLPNETLKLGILLQSLLYTLPALGALVWLMIKRRDLDLTQRLAVIGALIGFYLFGLIVSAKIGGGGDLHNLDMFIITLLVIIVLLGSTIPNEHQQPIPAWLTGLIGLSICLMAYSFTPFDPGARQHARLELPDENNANETLAIVRSAVQTYSVQGDILFMDQRQLITFQYIPAIHFLPDYEKKYMMDQAMANNATYFRDYYVDLARQRFSLIVTEPLHTYIKEGTIGGGFSEENDMWVQWVSNPTLCYYESIFTSKENRIELLVPKQNPVGCEQYLK